MGLVARPLLIAKTGDTLETIRHQYGDFDWMFGRFVDGVDVHMVDVVRSPEGLPPVKPPIYFSGDLLGRGPWKQFWANVNSRAHNFRESIGY